MNKLAKNSLVVMLLLLPGFLIAQQDSIPKQATLKRGFCEDVPFIIGDFSPLNEILIQNGFPALEPTYLGFAFGVSARPSNKDSYFTAKIFMLKTNSQYDFNNDSKNASIRFLGLQEDFHLDLVRSKKWRIGPDFGFGFGVQRLKLYEKVYTPPDFASALSPSVITHQETTKPKVKTIGNPQSVSSYSQSRKTKYKDILVGSPEKADVHSQDLRLVEMLKQLDKHNDQGGKAYSLPTHNNLQDQFLTST